MSNFNGRRGHGLRSLLRVAMLTLVAAFTMGVSTGIAVAVAPTAQTGTATNVTDTTATLNGTVVPGQNDTMYYFEYGTTTDYGTKTTPAGPLNGNAGKGKAVSADVTGLVASTLYHFRLVATNSAGPSSGTDATFRATQPTLTATVAPARVTFGHAVSITGQLSGSSPAGADLTLEENPYPYTGGFKSTGLKTTTTATGTYAFSVTPAGNTHYRVTTKGKPTTTSPEVAVRVRVKVSFRVSDRTPKRGQRVRFYGNVTPGHDGKLAKIQRRTRTGSWKTVATATLVTGTPVNGTATSKYSKRLRIRHSGLYRVRVPPADGDHERGTSAHRRLRVH